MEFLHVGQAALKLSTSGDPPASASQYIEITSVSHRAQRTWFSWKALSPNVGNPDSKEQEKK